MTPRRHDSRFHQLLALAREGNAEATSDLFREYGFDAEREAATAPQLPTRKTDRNHNQEEEK